MAVVIAVAVVVAKHSPIIPSANARIDVCKAVLDNRAPRVPDLFFEQAATPLAGKVRSLIDTLFCLAKLPLRLCPSLSISRHDVGYPICWAVGMSIAPL